MSTSAPRIVKCPACGGPSVYGPQNPQRPFCSERCRAHDLGAWAMERYRVAAQPERDDDAGTDPVPPATH